MMNPWPTGQVESGPELAPWGKRGHSLQREAVAGDHRPPEKKLELRTTAVCASISGGPTLLSDHHFHEISQALAAEFKGVQAPAVQLHCFASLISPFTSTIAPAQDPDYTELSITPQACSALLQSFPMAQNVLLPSLLFLTAYSSFGSKSKHLFPHEALSGLSDPEIISDSFLLRTTCTWLLVSPYHSLHTSP